MSWLRREGSSGDWPEPIVAEVPGVCAPPASWPRQRRERARGGGCAREIAHDRRGPRGRSRLSSTVDGRRARLHPLADGAPAHDEGAGSAGLAPRAVPLVPPAQSVSVGSSPGAAFARRHGDGDDLPGLPFGHPRHVHEPGARARLRVRRRAARARRLRGHRPVHRQAGREGAHPPRSDPPTLSARGGDRRPRRARTSDVSPSRAKRAEAATPARDSRVPASPRSAVPRVGRVASNAAPLQRGLPRARTPGIRLAS